MIVSSLLLIPALPFVAIGMITLLPASPLALYYVGVL